MTCRRWQTAWTLAKSSMFPTHCHFEDVGDGASLEADLQHIVRVALSLTGIAADPHIGQEVHFDTPEAQSLAGLAAAAGAVEAETPGVKAAHPGLG